MFVSCEVGTKHPVKPNHQLHNSKVAEIKTETPKVDEEAISLRPTGIYSESDARKYGEELMTKAEPIVSLKSEAIVYVLEIDSNFVTAITLTGIKGCVLKSHLKGKNPSSWNKEKFLTHKKIQKINTKVDGVDVQVVNLWESKSTRERIVDKLTSNDAVAVLQVQGEYVQLGTVNGKIGWCMRGFVNGL